MNITPPKRHLVDLLPEWLRANPDEGLTQADMCLKFGCSEREAAYVCKHLEHLGVIKCERNEDRPWIPEIWVAADLGKKTIRQHISDSLVEHGSVNIPSVAEFLSASIGAVRDVLLQMEAKGQVRRESGRKGNIPQSWVPV